MIRAQSFCLRNKRTVPTNPEFFLLRPEVQKDKKKVKKTKKTVIVIQGLSKRKYYVRVRAFSINEKGKVYGSYSKWKTVTVKK